MNGNFKSLFFKNTGIRQTIFKNAFWLTLSKVISKILVAILAILIARYLGAEEFGKFSFVFAFVLLFSVITDFGLITLTIREIARNTSLAKKYIGNIVAIKLILGLVTFGIIVLVFSFLHKTAEIKILVFLAAIWMIVQSFAQFFQSIFRAFEKMEYEALSKIIYSAILFIVAIYGMYLGWGLKGLIQGYVFAALIGLIVILFLTRIKLTKFKIETDLLFWKKLLNEAWPFALFTVFAIIYFQISVIMLSIMDTDKAVGLYSIAFNSVIVFLILADIVAGSVLPTLSKLVNKSNLFKRLIKKLIILLSITGLSLAIILFLGASSFIKLIYGIEFMEAAKAFQIMVWILPLRFMNYIFAVFLIALNLQKKRLNAAIICAVFNVLINLILIPVFSSTGAAISTLLTEIALFFIYFVFYRKSFKAMPNVSFND
jgi:O-antigen/teichoic acid export membrane protein